MLQPKPPRSVLSTVFFAVLAASTDAMPAAASGDVQLEITEVTVDFAEETVAIRGRHFDLPGPLRISLGEIGPITPLCTPSYTPALHTLECDFSSTGLPPPGDYLLTVSRGILAARSHKRDEHDLTIGGAGPPGPPGEAGEPGPQGPPGPAGTPNFYLRTATGTLSAASEELDVIEAIASCDTGDVVTGGGIVHHVPEGCCYSAVKDFTNAPNADGTGWAGRVERSMPDSSTLEVWAICADVAP